MARPRRGKKKGEDKRKSKESGSKLEVDDKALGDKSVSITTIFKSEDLLEISSILDVTDLDESHLLLGAVALSRFDIVKKLLHDKFPINAIQDGTTPLILSVKLKLIEMADFLIRKGADLCQGDGEGNNALLLAAQHADWDQESFLDFWNRIKESRLDMNHANKVGHTILHCLVKRQWVAAIDIILQCSSSLDVNHVTGKGVTALMMACSRHQEDIIRSLLRSKADLYLEDQKGCTALCYAIAYFIQKRMFVPNHAIEQLIAYFEMDSSIISYLNRRLDLLVNPPEENFAVTMTSVIVHIITFTVRCLDSGMEILLRLSIFKRIGEAIERHMNDCEYVCVLMGILGETTRYCECCCSYEPKENIVDEFCESGIPNLCLRIIKRHSPMRSNHLQSLLLPIILTCYHPRMKYWLQNNFNSILQPYKDFIHGAAPPLNFYPDEAHAQMVKKQNIDFKVLMNQLQRGELIHVPDTSIYSKGYRNALNGEKAIAKSIESRNEKGNKGDCEIRFKGNDEDEDEDEAVITMCDEPERRIEIICDEPSNRIKLMKRASKALGIRGWDPYGSPSRMNCSEKEQANRLWDPAEDKSDVSSDERHPDVYKDVQETENEQLSAEDKILPSWEAGDAVINGPYDAEINPNENYSKTLNDLNERFYSYLSKYEKRWQKDYEDGYPDALGDVDDYLKLMETLPKIENDYWNMVTQNWNNLVKKLEKGLENNVDVCKSAIAGLKLYIEKLEEEDECKESAVSESDDVTNIAFEYEETDLMSCNGHQPLLDSSLEQTVDDWAARADHQELQKGMNKFNAVSSSPPPERLSSCGTEADLEMMEVFTGGLLQQDCSQSRTQENINDVESEGDLNITCKICQSNASTSYCKVTKYTEQLMVLNQIGRDSMLMRDVNKIVLMANESQRKDFGLSPMGGVFGPAMLALDAFTRQPLVVKSITKNTGKKNKDVIESYRKVISPLLDVHSEHLVPYTHYLHIGGNIFLATPLCERNLSEYLMLLKTTAGFSEDLAHMMVNQIVRGLHFLHHQKPPIVHGNLKPSNILADSNGNLRLSEFGLNVLRRHTEPTVGLRIWWAQETLKQYDTEDAAAEDNPSGKMLYVTTESDIQTCGMILHYLATGGVHPFGKYPLEIMINLNENRRPALVTKSHYISDLVAWMLDQEPKMRPTSWQILNHVYVWDKEKQWKFLLTCAGISTDQKITLPVDEFHRALDKFANDHKVVVKWVGVIQWGELTPVLDPLDYSDTISGLLSLLRDSFPSSGSWFIKYFPMVVLTLYRLIENTHWANHPDFASFNSP